MIIILLRTVILYTVLIVTMRFMGKRQLGELEISDLATTLLISEIASLPLTNPDVPLSHAVIPVLVLMSLEVLLSGGLLKIPRLKGLFAVRPAILVRHGCPDRAAMRRVRVSAEELLSQLRQKDVADIAEVAYAILEPNGQISVLKNSADQPPTAEQLGMQATERGMMHLIISDGEINDRNLALAGKDQAWLQDQLSERKLTREEIFLLLADDGGRVRIYTKEDSAA